MQLVNSKYLHSGLNRRAGYATVHDEDIKWGSHVLLSKRKAIKANDKKCTVCKCFGSWVAGQNDSMI